MFADGRVQLQVIGGQLRRLPRRIETIGSQLERNVRAEHKGLFTDEGVTGFVAPGGVAVAG